VDVRRHRRDGIGRCKAGHGGVNRESFICRDKHERDDSTTRAVRWGWEVDLSVTGAIRVNGVACVLHVVGPMPVSKTGELLRHWL
jgi:hypothetical protein